MPTFIPQPSFTGGEWAPSLHARQDLTKFGVSLRACLNFLIHAHGGASNRPGMQFVGETKDSTKVARLIPFSFSTTQTYSLEFGDQILRVIKDGAYVIDSSSPPDIYEIVTPYLEADLPLLNFTQSADVMTIDHPSYADRELSRTDHDAWALTTVTRGTTSIAPTVPTATPNAAFGAGPEVHQYIITTVVGNDESLASAIAASSGVLSAWPAGGHIKVAWTAAATADYYNIYKRPNSGGSYGFIGTSDTVDFIDDNIQADFSQTPPPSNNNPFGSADNYASCVAYFQERLCHAGPNNNPQTTWMSKTGVYKNFNVSIPPRDDDSVQVTVTAREVNAVRHLVPIGKSLIALTSGYPWVLRGPSGTAITPNNIERDPQGKRGCSHVPPLVIGSTILFVQEKGSIVRELEFSFDKDLYDGTDLSILANHLFEDSVVKEWAFAEAPHSIIWCVMEDGSLIGCTYMKEHEVWGWHRHETDGTVESVCSISEGTEDAVYFIVKRTINGITKRYVERLHSRHINTIEDAFFVDSGLTLDSPQNVESITQASPGVVGITGHGHSNGDLIDFNSIVGMTELNGNRYKAANVTANTFELTNQFDDTNINTAIFGAYISGGEAREAVTAISGLDHLEGETVTILGNGNVLTPQVVVSGDITLPYASSRVHIGLPYQSDLETLPSDFKGTVPTYGKKRIVEEVVVDMLNSRGLWAGYDADHLTELKQRGLANENYNEPVALFTGKARLSITSKWQDEGTVYLRQKDPLPINILGVAPGEDPGA